MPAKIAVVTGGTAGLGRAIVRELAERGWDVAILARGEDGLQGAAADVMRAGRRALPLSVDVADNDAVEAAAEQIERDLGEIDLWVNDAMAGVFGEFVTTEPRDFERAVQVNFFGFVNGTRAALTRMKPRNRGHIIQIGSALAHRGIPLQAAYCASKHAITGFTESVLTELIHDKSAVRISQVDMPAMNTVQFNWVKSQLPHHPQPVPTIFEPETCARAVADVADSPRRRSWIGEPTVMTVLGNRFVAPFLDVYLAKTGYSGQQAPDKKDPMLPSNLYEPVAGDHGSRGIFSDKAKSTSPQIWYTQHRTVSYVAAIGAAAAGVGALVAGLKKRA
ncbi:short-subunit dehydrogenase [Frondihabitans sp. PhB188]|uniref:SDR family oxidoreductase n=1 Tax=Frondihabitans sp. PhB188 TaxID=2485200 RepID=UPI000F47B742|nr:SDR family oxidoreductase [Frondihabitans sp. PhB188]ROQ41614.1 short-subunit dehydrogenase [Frondihabitans sp. PhB188]